MKKILFSALVSLGLLAGSVVYATPTTTFEPNIMPTISSRWDIGTSTKPWNTITTNLLCLANDSCRTTWPTGGGGGASGGVNTSTANYFTYYLTGTAVTGTPLMQFANNSIVFNTNTLFLTTSASSTTSTNLYVSSLANITKLGVNSSSPIALEGLQGLAGNEILDITSATGSPLLHIRESGNIGFNSSSPNAFVTVVDPLAGAGGDSTSTTGMTVKIIGAIGKFPLLIYSPGVDTQTPSLVRFEDGTGNKARIAVTGANVVGFNAAVGNALNFGANGPTTIDFVIINNHYVGVGTTTPLSSFSVQAQQGNENIVDFASSSGATALRILSTGNVGINTNTPLSLLSVQGVSSTNYFQVVSTTGGTVLAVTTNDRVGINSSSPQYALSVQGGDFGIIGGGFRDSVGSLGSNGMILQTNGSLDTWISTSSLGLYTGWTIASSSIDPGTNVASGTTVIVTGSGPVTSSRSGTTLTVGFKASGIVAGAYGSATAVPVLTIDQFGRVTSNSTSSIAIDASAITSGVLAINRGGTNSSTIGPAGSVAYSNSTNFLYTAAGTTNQVLVSNGSGAPAFVNTSSLSLYTGWSLATSTVDLSFNIASGTQAIFNGINAITSTRTTNAITFSLINSGITAGTYGSTSTINNYTINAQGLITAVSTSTISLPNSGALLTTTTGQVGIDTTSGQLRWNDGTNTNTAVGYVEKFFSLSSSSINATIISGSTTRPIAIAMNALTIPSFACFTTSTGGTLATATVRIGDGATVWTSAFQATSSKSGVVTPINTVSSNNAFSAGKQAWVQVGNITGTYDFIVCAFKRTIDPD